jgi:DNA-binding CsgD family transcriptional regulator
VEDLPKDSLSLLQALCVLGGPSTLGRIARIAGIAAPAAALGPLEARGLIVVGAGAVHRHRQVALSPDLERELPKLVLTPTRRRALHQAAAALDGNGDGAARAHRHRVAAAERLDESLADELESAARHAPSRPDGGPSPATLLEWAADLSGSREAGERRLLAAAFHHLYSEERCPSEFWDKVADCSPSDLRSCALAGYALLENQSAEAESHLSGVLADIARPNRSRSTGDSEGDVAAIAHGIAAAISVRDARGQDAVRHAVAALRCYPDDPALERWLHRLLAAGRCYAHGPRAALDARYCDGIDPLGGLELGAPQEAVALLDQGCYRVLAGDLRQGVRDLTELVERPAAAAPTEVRGRAYQWLALGHHLLGNWRRAEDCARRAIRATDPDATDTKAGSAHSVGGGGGSEDGNGSGNAGGGIAEGWTEGRVASAGAGEDEAADAGAGRVLSVSGGEGRVADVGWTEGGVADAGEGPGAGEGSGAGAAARYALSAMLAAHRGEWDLADNHLRRSQDRDLASMASPDDRVLSVFALAATAHARGDLSRALPALAELSALAAPSAPSVSSVPPASAEQPPAPAPARPATSAGTTEVAGLAGTKEGIGHDAARKFRSLWQPLYAEAMVECGSEQEAAAALAELDDLAGQVPYLRVAHSRLAGRLAERRRDPGTARWYYESVLHPPHERSPERSLADDEPDGDADVKGGGAAPLQLALLEHCYGRLLGTLGEPREAVSWLTRARTRLAVAGAAPYARRCSADLAVCAAPAAEVSRYAVLTERERAVAQLVGAGLTNQETALRLYISVKTVEYHLAKIYGKLGIGSRRHLARLTSPGPHLPG